MNKVVLFLVLAGTAVLLASAGWAGIPAPPVNQSIGMGDVLISAQTEAECRACHSSGVNDRHHLLVGKPIPPGSLVPYPDADGNHVRDATYGCLNCHRTTSTVVRDCVVCHTKSPHHTTPAAQARHCKSCHGSVVDDYDDGHYIPTYQPSLVTPTPNGGDGLPRNSRGKGAGACDYCHDNDGLSTPIILSSAVLHHSAASNCSWCHQTDPLSFHTDREDDAMHAPGKKKPFTNGCTDCHGADLRGGVARSCFSCHGREWDNDSGSGHSPYFSTAGDMRKCESCHGPNSLHSIQADSPKAPTGTIVVGGELAGYGHVGRDAGPNDSDCWGCHGFKMSSVPGFGPVAPTVNAADRAVITAGTPTTVLLTGGAFVNTAGGELYEAGVNLTGADGSSVNLTPDVVADEGMLAVTIPSTTGPGNYRLRAVKEGFESNPVVISIVPKVRITRATSQRGTVTITGSGFAAYATGLGTSVTGTARGKAVKGTVVSWRDEKIVAKFGQLPNVVTVKSVFGSATSAVR